MYDYFKGKLIEKNPTDAIVECNGVAFALNISLQTYTQIKDCEEIKLYAHLVIKEDSHTLFGFFTQGERSIFKHLISVSGVGANTARVILSSMNTEEVYTAIVTGNVAAFQSVKGIGTKTAQRILLDLKDKVSKDSSNTEIIVSKHNTNKEEALSALVMLGFAKQSASKVLQTIIEKQGTSLGVEDLVRAALKML